MSDASIASLHDRFTGVCYVARYGQEDKKAVITYWECLNGWARCHHGILTSLMKSGLNKTLLVVASTDTSVFNRPRVDRHLVITTVGRFRFREASARSRFAPLPGSASVLQIILLTLTS
jgi:hypothetical protein